MKSNTKQFPKNKIAWLWENMEGKRALYFVGILGTVLYNILQLTIPYFSGKIRGSVFNGGERGDKSSGTP